ncbi:hypothetical protein C8F04DRAFT_1261117 [Mycena alexandri]|uniref:Uncharacterized protein n=1 Tax=Mycena alexandri TaxID=1745969 RepID=A0AAD6X3B4_9AGAR|nr:hypothetical protein C8F04DRAFT_1261117 [Mycena alexandri]
MPPRTVAGLGDAVAEGLGRLRREMWPLPVSSTSRNGESIASISTPATSGHPLEDEERMEMDLDVGGEPARARLWRPLALTLRVLGGAFDTSWLRKSPHRHRHADDDAQLGARVRVGVGAGGVVNAASANSVKNNANWANNSPPPRTRTGSDKPLPPMPTSPGYASGELAHLLAEAADLEIRLERGELPGEALRRLSTADAPCASCWRAIASAGAATGSVVEAAALAPESLGPQSVGASYEGEGGGGRPAWTCARGFPQVDMLAGLCVRWCTCGCAPVATCPRALPWADLPAGFHLREEPSVRLSGAVPCAA